MNPAQKRFHQLDFLRFLGAVVVALMHFCNMIIHPYREYFNGGAMVVMFFVLSGFALSYKYLHGQEVKPEYFGARMLRLWIPYIAVLAYAWLWWRPVGVANIVSVAAEGWNIDTFSGGDYALYSRAIPPAWTLMAELVCSLVMPLMVMVARRSTALHVVYTIGLVAFHVPCADLLLPFGVGVLIAKYESHVERIPAWLARGMVYVYIVIVGSPMFHGPILWPYIVPSAMIVVAFLRLPALGDHAALRFLGKLSYPLYLCHWPMMFIVGVPIVQSTITNSWAWIGLWLAASLLASAVLLPVEWVAINALKIAGRIRAIYAGIPSPMTRQ